MSRVGTWLYLVAGAGMLLVLHVGLHPGFTAL